MPKVVKIKSQLKQNKNKTFLITVFLMLSALCFLAVSSGLFVAILFQKITLHIAFPVVLLVISLTLFFAFFIYQRKFEILKAGVRGENSTLDILKKLPREYTIISNPVILNRGVSLELDFVVIGKNGVFIVESKNHRGIISGKTSKSIWKQVKHGKNDRVYEKEINNPVKQSFRQGRKMLELFKDFDITADIYPILFFADSRAELRITDDANIDVSIFKDETELLEFIQTTKGRKTVSKEELVKIIHLFKR